MTLEELNITWEDEHKDYIFQQLAEMYSVSETADNTLTEFSDEWDVETTTEEGKRRAVQIRKWIYDRVRYYAYDKRCEEHQRRILQMRQRWERDIESHVREANKANRIRDLAKIKDLAIGDGEYGAAVRALAEIRTEMEGVKLRVEGMIEYNLNIDADIRTLLLKAGLTEEYADSFIRELGNGQLDPDGIAKIARGNSSTTRN
ncbi:MAG: hypothetical protein O7D34_00355 [Ignavibacteria bacterium]|nr:hypothetical protein [Ignavibacteria bacterium]